MSWPVRATTARGPSFFAQTTDSRPEAWAGPTAHDFHNYSAKEMCFGMRYSDVMEFLDALADPGADGSIVRLPPGRLQPIAADDQLARAAASPCE